MKRPRLNMLRTFEVAGRRLSFSLAADELNVSQAAVSQQIRNLEAYLGRSLFIRNHRQLSLNSIGAAYLSSVQEALDRLDTVTDQLFPDRPNQTVTILCTSSIASLWLAPNVGAFNAEHPEINLHIQTLDAEHRSGQETGADLEVFISRDNATDPQTQVLLESSIVPVASPQLFESQARPQAPQDIPTFELIHVLGYDDDWHRWFRTHGLNATPVPRGLMVDGSLIAIETVLLGDGIMLGRRPFIDHYLQSGQLVEVFNPPFALTATYFLRPTQSKAGRRSTDQVVRWLARLAERP
jgi:LysR family glycine cleavage system transcriptional activator